MITQRRIFWAVLFTLVLLMNLLGATPEKLPAAEDRGNALELSRETATTTEALVVRVIDGDTIEIEGGERVRYIGIDTPELHHGNQDLECFGEEAKNQNEQLVLGKRVTLVRDVSNRDKYGRLLRYVFVGDTFVNGVLVQNGFAHSASYPPDISRQEELREAERQARTNARGLWSACSQT